MAQTAYRGSSSAHRLHAPNARHTYEPYGWGFSTAVEPWQHRIPPPPWWGRHLEPLQPPPYARHASGFDSWEHAGPRLGWAPYHWRQPLIAPPIPQRRRSTPYPIQPSSFATSLQARHASAAPQTTPLSPYDGENEQRNDEREPPKTPPPQPSPQRQSEPDPQAVPRTLLPIVRLERLDEGDNNTVQLLQAAQRQLLCGICEERAYTRTIRCGHVLCDQCVKGCKKRCPYCRRGFKLSFKLHFC